MRRISIVLGVVTESQAASQVTAHSFRALGPGLGTPNSSAPETPGGDFTPLTVLHPVVNELRMRCVRTVQARTMPLQ